MTTLVSISGIAILLVVAFIFSKHRNDVNWRTISVAFLLQLLIGGFALYLPFGKAVLESISSGVTGVLAYGQTGIDFMFGEIGQFKLGFVFAFHVPPLGPLQSGRNFDSGNPAGQTVGRRVIVVVPSLNFVQLLRYLLGLTTA